MTAPTTARAILNLKEVMALTGLSRSYIYLLERQGEFPPRRRIGKRKSGWMKAEVDEWIEALPMVTQDDSPMGMHERKVARDGAEEEEEATGFAPIPPYSG